MATAAGPTRVYLDTPFLIQANKPDILHGSNIEVFNSTASVLVDYQDEIPDPNHTDDWVNFSFVWNNDTGQDAEINTEALLVVKGEADCFAHAGHIPVIDEAGSSLIWIAQLQILEMWNQPPTSPIPEADQTVLILDGPFALDMSTGLFDSGDHQVIDVFQAYPLAHRTFLTVPRNGSLVFQVSLNIGSTLFGGGWCTSNLSPTAPGGFVLCPFVELQVSTSGIMTN